jgi:outer membrane protein OmpA-like peptidoglycan-associated protein
VALSNEAINISKAHLESVKIEADLARRRTEMQQVEAQAQEAEARAAVAREEAERLAVEASVLAERTASLQIEATKLRGQLQGALSTVADTRNSARGYVVNLPDILFGFNEATLKPEASVVLAKLAGILLIVSDLTVAVEGHTDSIGSREYNMGLSLRRAESVLDFLAEQGLPRSRMGAVGLGPDRPIASNDTEEGRGRNRRVEIVIANKEQRAAGR